MVRTMLVACALTIAAPAAFAQETRLKPQGTNSQGSCVGQASSANKQNGEGVREQARSGNRSTLVQAFKDTDRDNTLVCQGIPN